MSIVSFFDILFYVIEYVYYARKARKEREKAAAVTSTVKNAKIFTAEDEEQPHCSHWRQDVTMTEEAHCSSSRHDVIVTEL